MSGVSVGSRARHIAQLAAERVSTARCRTRGSRLHARLLFLVLLPVQMFLASIFMETMIYLTIYA